MLKEIDETYNMIELRYNNTNLNEYNFLQNYYKNELNLINSEEILQIYKKLIHTHLIHKGERDH